MENFKNSSERFEYKYFADKNERHDIYEFSKGLTEYLKKEHIDNVIFLDRSARGAWVGVNEYWNQNYKQKEQEKPNMYFINPDGVDVAHQTFRAFDHYDRSDVLFDQLELLTNGSSPMSRKADEIEINIKNRFEEVFSNLSKEKDKPLVVFDTCAHTGETLKKVITLLDRLGFDDVRIITANSPDSKSGIKTEKKIDKKTYIRSCYPFGKIDLIKKGDDVITERNDDISYRERSDGVQLRIEIKKIIQEKGN